MPSDTTMEGMIRLATVTKKSAEPPRSCLRKARPASTDSSTVRPITTAPSASERRSAAHTSTVPSPSASCANQCSDQPRTGKVSPPCGPWKLSTKMVKVGP